MKEFCDVKGVIDSKEAAKIAGALTVAWLRRWLDDDKAMDAWLNEAAVKAKFPAVQWTAAGF
jgi:hypothetical protein